MPSIAGPKLQVPSPQTAVHSTSSGKVAVPWQVFFHGVQQIAFNGSRSGPTASRPTSDLDGRWIGMPYFDTTLGIVIHLQAVNPDVWVRWDGTPV